MKLKFDVASIHQVGKRERNEDSIFPNNEIDTSLDNLFLVCDGVGGHAKGEIASDLVCSQMNTFFSINGIDVSDRNVIDDAVRFVETKFDSYIANNLGSAGMASTLTLLHLHKGGATVAHIGDSRVYQFRNGEIVFKTKDHSLLQSLLDAGELTPEQAKDFPHKNQITRALQGASVRKVRADVSRLTDVQAGDIFMLCSDGILEAFEDDDMLKELFKEFSDSVDTIASKIAQVCNEVSRDNFSAYFVQIEEAYISLLDKALIQEIQKEVGDQQIIVTNNKKKDTEVNKPKVQTITELMDTAVPAATDMAVTGQVEETVETEQAVQMEQPFVNETKSVESNAQDKQGEVKVPIASATDVIASVKIDQLLHKDAVKYESKEDDSPRTFVRERIQSTTIDHIHMINSQERSKNNMLKIIIIVILLALLALVGYSLFDKKNKSKFQELKNRGVKIEIKEDKTSTEPIGGTIKEQANTDTVRSVSSPRGMKEAIKEQVNIEREVGQVKGSHKTNTSQKQVEGSGNSNKTNIFQEKAKTEETNGFKTQY